MTFYDALAVGVGLAVLLMYVQNRSRNVTYLKSKVDQREYLVQKTADSEGAADTLARLNDKALLLIKHLGAKYPDDDRVVRLQDRYNPDALSEGGQESGYTSYSVNKGQRIVMCLRSKEEGAKGAGAIEAENTLVYVLVHELAHIATEDVGHTPSFWDNFRFLVKEAVAARVYRDTDYSQSPVSYCGLTIDSSAVTRPPKSKEPKSKEPQSKEAPS